MVWWKNGTKRKGTVQSCVRKRRIKTRNLLLNATIKKRHKQSLYRWSRIQSVPARSEELEDFAVDLTAVKPPWPNPSCGCTGICCGHSKRRLETLWMFYPRIGMGQGKVGMRWPFPLRLEPRNAISASKPTKVLEKHSNSNN